MRQVMMFLPYNGTSWNLKGSLTSTSWSPANFTLSGSEVINRNVNVRLFIIFWFEKPQGLVNTLRINECTLEYEYDENYQAVSYFLNYPV
jgi:hypothetical protein